MLIVATIGLAYGLAKVELNSGAKTKDSLGSSLKGIQLLAILVAATGFALIALISLVAHKPELIASFGLALVVAALPISLNLLVKSHLSHVLSYLSKNAVKVDDLADLLQAASSDTFIFDDVAVPKEPSFIVSEFLIGKKLYSTTPNGYNPEGEIWDYRKIKPSLGSLLKSDLFFAACTLTSNSHLHPPAHNKPNWFVDGDPADGAPITLATRAGASPELLNRNFIELLRIEPNNFNQLTTSLRRANEDQSLFLFTKGSPEEVLKYSSEILEDGFIHRLTKSDKKKLVRQAEQLAKNHTSLTALAYRNFPSDAAPAQENIEKIEGSLTWLGLVALDDQQAQIENALKHLAAGGNKLIFSGKNNLYSAELSAITKTTAPVPITAQELANLSDAQLARKLTRQLIILEPNRRADGDRVLRLLVEAGHEVSVLAGSHDPKNKDKPWLQNASIVPLQENVVLQSLASTQIAKLLQVNMRLKKAYRTVHDMTQTVLKLSLALALVVLASFFLNIIFDIPILISIPEILVFSLLIELPILLPLKYDTSPSVVTKTPVKKDIFSKPSLKDTARDSLAIATLATAGYFWFFIHNLISGIDLNTNSVIHFQATTLVFAVLVFCLLANTLKQRSLYRLISRTQLQNRRFWKGLALASTIALLIIYVPFIGGTLDFGSLGMIDWISALVLAAAFVLISALMQHIQKHSRIELIKKHSVTKIKHHLSKLKYQA